MGPHIVKGQFLFVASAKNSTKKLITCCYTSMYTSLKQGSQYKKMQWIIVAIPVYCES